MIEPLGTGTDAAVDVAVVGAGPCGLAVGVATRRRDLSCTLFEQGCVVSSIAQYPTYVTFFSTAERIAIGGIPFTVATEKPTRRDAMAYYRGVVDACDLDVRPYEKVERVEATGAVEVTRALQRAGGGPDRGFVVHSRSALGAHRTSARTVVLATGYFGSPNRLGVPGEDLPHVTHYYREGHEAFRRHALVVGGGNSSVETAIDLVRCGARVTVVHLGPTFDRNIKPWVRPAFEACVREGTIELQWSTRVTGIEPGVVHLAGEHGAAARAADHVYLMTGFTPSSELVGPLGVHVDAVTGVPAHDPETMESNVPGVYVAGVLVSGNDANKIFIENGRDHGELIAAAVARLGHG